MIQNKKLIEVALPLEAEKRIGHLYPKNEKLGPDIESLEGDSHKVRYLRQPFQREPDFGAASVNYYFAELLARAEAPA